MALEASDKANWHHLSDLEVYLWMYFKVYLQTQCLLDWHHGKIKWNQPRSTNKSQNNSKGPCEDAGGNRYNSIYIHSITSPIIDITWKAAQQGRSHGSKTAIKKPDYGLQMHMGAKTVLFGEMSSGLAIMTSVMFGGKKWNACKAKNTIPTVKHGSDSIML